MYYNYKNKDKKELFGTRNEYTVHLHVVIQERKNKSERYRKYENFLNTHIFLHF